MTWRTGEDPDGTRHYWSFPGLGTVPYRSSLSRRTRRRLNVLLGIGIYAPVLAAGVGAWIGHRYDAMLRGALIGACGTFVTEIVLVSLWTLVAGLRHRRRRQVPR